MLQLQSKGPLREQMPKAGLKCGHGARTYKTPVGVLFKGRHLAGDVNWTCACMLVLVSSGNSTL